MSSEQDNRMVWDRSPGRHEVWFTTVSHAASRTGFWIRYTLHAPTPGRGEPHAMLWFARFDAEHPSNNFGIHKRFAIETVSHTPSPFRLAVGDAEQRHDGSRGALTGDGHEVRWDLRWPPAAESLRHLPAVLYNTPLSGSKVLSPNGNVPAHGTITVDGRDYVLDGDALEQSHIWGKKLPYQWAWSHICAFDGGTQATFVSMSGRLKRGAVILPRATSFVLQLGGEEIAFRDPWKIPFARSDAHSGRYHLVGASATVRVEAELTCRVEDMILAEYVDPDGDPAFCHNTCSGSAVIQVKRRSPFVGRWRDAERLTASHTAHWEWGARAGDAASIKRHHKLV